MVSMNIKSNSPVGKLPNVIFLATAASFLFFLLYSTPHRVHHLFEEDQESPCVAYTLVRSCQISHGETLTFGFADVEFKDLPEIGESWIAHFFAATTSQRAPPFA